jgi:hypothetical protein
MFDIVNLARAARAVGTRGGLLRGLVALACCVSGLACGGSSSAPPRSARAERETAQLVILVTAPQSRPGPSVGNAVRRRLAQLGYRVTLDASAHHDVVADIQQELTENQSFMTVVVDGKKKVSHTAHVTLTLQADGLVLNSATVDLDAADEATDEDVAPLVAAITGPALHEHAKRVQAGKAKADLEQKAQLAQEEEEERARRKAERQKEGDQKAWLGARTLECRSPARLDACDGVRGYLMDHPKGAHAAEAQQILEEAEPKLLQLVKDDNAWRGAGADSCRASRDPDSCVGVELYLTKYPGGLHADEARGILQGGSQ